MRNHAESSLWRSLLWSIIGACAGLAAGWCGRSYSLLFEEPILRTFASPIIGGAFTGALVEFLTRSLGERAVTRFFIPAVLGMIPGMMFELSFGSLVFTITAGAGIGLMRWFLPQSYAIFNIGSNAIQSEPSSNVHEHAEVGSV
jgi:hypothetical protein